jgi:signal transduction histidine kinase
MGLGRQSAFLISLLAVSFACPAVLADEPSPPSVLVLNQSNSYRPWSDGVINEIRTVMMNRSGRSATVYTEDLDLYRFNGPNYLKLTENYFREKYRNRPLGVIMPIGPSALDYALRIRASFRPDMPIVFAAVDKKTSELKAVPGVTGITIQLTLTDMITAARSLLPKTEHFALVGDRLEGQLYYSRFAEELSEYSKKVQFIDLMGLPLSELRRRVANLPERTVILYVGIHSVTGRGYSSAELIPQIADVANCPVVVTVETYFGTGAVGGFLLSPIQVGREAGRLALRILGGEDPSTIPVTTSASLRPMFDWRQLQRWNISEDNLPPGSEVRFRAPSGWEQYRWEIIAVAGIMLIQSGLLSGLIIERHRRHTAEEEARRRVMQVIHLNRIATAGALSASVAHELNQPLGAIMNYAETAALLLSDAVPNVPLLKEIMVDIRRDDQRASEVIKHMRGLLKQQSEADLQTFDLNVTINASIHIVESEAAKRCIALDIVQATNPFWVRGDQVQLQQVILNLIANGMDAVSECSADQRRLLIQAAPSGGKEVEVLVSDSGSGVPRDALERIFDSFYTTKTGGTGLGLSIARTIVEAHRGRIWAENRKGGGAIFRFTLPLHKSALVS